MPLDPTPNNPRSARISGRFFGWTSRVASAARRANWTPVVMSAILIAVIAGALYFSYRENSYRKLHGHVTPVTASHWKTTVNSVQEHKAVVLYFHFAGQPYGQSAVVRQFAWENARHVKVLSVDLSKPENVAIAARFNLHRSPSFVAVYRGRIMKRFDGVPAGERDLRRLLRLVGAW